MTGGRFFSTTREKARRNETDRVGRTKSGNSRYRAECQVMKFLGDFQDLHSGLSWRCLTTGRAGWVLLAAIDEPGGIATGLQFSYPQSAFKRGVLPRER